MKGLLKAKPKDPISYMITKLENPEPKRIFIIGPPGCRKKEKALTLGEYFNYASLPMGDLLEKEIAKKSDYGKKIAEAKEKYSYVDDQLVTELITK